MSSIDSAAEAPSEREIVNTRVLAAPRERVFGAFADPQRLARWWGPKGFTNRFELFDLRPGGLWRFVMRGPDGAEYPDESVFVEVAPPQRIVFNHLQPEFQMTIALDACDGGTRITWRMRFASAAERDRVRDFVGQANEQNLDRLQSELLS